MSVSTNDIKKKIVATENMSKITKAMQMVSVAKLGKTENRVKHFQDYHTEIKNTLLTLRTSEHVKEHLFLKGHGSNKKSSTGFLVITSNRGLVGGYNHSLFKILKDNNEYGYNNELFKLVRTQLTNDDDSIFYVTGQKGAIFAKNELPEAHTEIFLFPDEIQYTDILDLASKLISDYTSGKVSSIVVIYQDFLSNLVQEPSRKTLLPIKFETMNAKVPHYEFYPTEIAVVEDLLTQYVLTSLYEIFLSANQSEHAARMNSMSSATDNAEDIIAESKLIYNRARQAAITQELNEIVAGANAVN